MELSTVLIGIGALLLFVVPIVYLTWSQKKRNNNFSKQFIALAQDNGLYIHEADYWNNTHAIGIDNDAKRLLFMKKQDNGDEKYVIDLNKADSCRVLNESRNVKGASTEVIDKLGLAIHFKDVKIQNKMLDFYNADESMSMNEELMLANKWSEIINKNIK